MALLPNIRVAQKNTPRNINQMPEVIFFARLDLGQNSSFMDGHKLKI